MPQQPAAQGRGVHHKRMRERVLVHSSCGSLCQQSLFAHPAVSPQNCLWHGVNAGALLAGLQAAGCVFGAVFARCVSSSDVPVDGFELLVLTRSDWQARLHAPYGLPLARVRDMRVIAAADYPERLVKRLDGLLLEAAERGYDAPSGWRELFDVLVGVRWAQVVTPADSHGRVLARRAPCARFAVASMYGAKVLDPTRLQQWWQVCAAKEWGVVARLHPPGLHRPLTQSAWFVLVGIWGLWLCSH